MFPVQQTTTLLIDTPSRFQAALEQAVRVLREGGLVALPTETVYGLAADAFNPEAVGRLFHAKGRPSHNPVIVHVAGIPMAQRCTSHWPVSADKLARAFWPGPLTLVLPKALDVPSSVTAGGPTVALRWPAHPFIQAVIQNSQLALAAPSANRSGKISPTRADHVLASLGGRIPLLIDGGPCSVGIESTVLDLSHSSWRILRPGLVGRASIAAIIGSAPEIAPLPPSPEAVLPSPGLLDRHYAPDTPVRLLLWNDDLDLDNQLNRLLNLDQPTPPPRPHWPICIIAHTRIPDPARFCRVVAVPSDPVGFAGRLYAELHACDQLHTDLIVVEDVPRTDEWLGIADRLARATR
jgi:L-threonylcarbamoyladenylate synthase